MEKVLILGSSGLLGRSLFEKLKSDNIKLFHNGLNKRKINLCNKTLLRKLIYSIEPSLIINTSGATNIENCEKNKKLSNKINYELIKEIFELKKIKKLKFNLIHISTDQMYNLKKGRKSHENSKLFLMNTYCKQKRMAEKICLKNKALVFRTNFFGKSINNKKSFSDWIYYSFKSKKKFFLFDDVYFNPIRINTLIKLISSIIKTKKFKVNGIYNLGSKDPIYKNDFAILFASKTSVIHDNYTNINVNKFLKVKRSTNMFMDVNKFERKFKLRLPNIKAEIINEAKNYIKQ